jgi:hypothetical protein
MAPISFPGTNRRGTPPAAMIQAVGAVVHDDAHPDEAYELFNELAHEPAVA